MIAAKWRLLDLGSKVQIWGLPPDLPCGYMPGLLGVVNCFIPEDFSKTAGRFNEWRTSRARAVGPLWRLYTYRIDI